MEITHLPFLDVLQDITSKFNKIPNKDFIKEGKYAIIDQGANSVAGYTNDESLIIDVGYPVIVFGDHTRTLKYINYPFAIGADGVKVLSVDTKKAYPLYVFYFLKYIKIPNAGYSRHYKFLKEKKIALPPNIEDQKRIAKTLSQCEQLAEKRKESINLLDNLLKSKFNEMFYNSVYPIKSIEEVSLNIIDCPHSTPKYLESISEYPCIRTSEIKNGYINWDSMKYTDFDGYVQRVERLVPQAGDIIFAREGTVGDAAIIPENVTLSLGQRVMMFRVNPAFAIPEYFWAFLRSDKTQHIIRSKSIGATVRRINISEVKKIQCPVPPIEIQNHFGEIVQQIDKLKRHFSVSLQALENLYGTVSQKAFNGELDLSKVNISDMEQSENKDLESTNEDLTEDQLEKLMASFEHTLPTGEVPSNRDTDIRNISIRQFLELPEDDDATDGAEFSYMDKDFFYQFILAKRFPNVTFTLPELEKSARKYILRGTGFEFTYENWKSIIFRFLGARPALLEQVLDEYKDGEKLTKAIKLRLTDETFKV